MNIKLLLFFAFIFTFSFVYSMDDDSDLIDRMHNSDLTRPWPSLPWELVRTAFGAEQLTYGCETRAGCYPMPARAKSFFKQRVKYWLRRGASIDCCCPDGLYTPLGFAAHRCDFERCSKLLELGADVNCADAFYTPLAAAIHGGEWSVINFLINHGADVNKASNPFGITPLMVAAHKGDSLATELLLEANADLLKTDVWGNNALMWAKNHPEYMANFVLCIALKKQFSPFLTFLCCLKQAKRLGSPKERFIADAMYQNRNKIWQEYIKISAPFSEMLRHRNHQGMTAYDCMGGGKYISDGCLLAILLRPSLECSVKERIALVKRGNVIRLPSFPYVG